MKIFSKPIPSLYIVQNYSLIIIIIYYLDLFQVEAIIPILLIGKGGQTIMAGDPKQMPPIVIDNFARDRGLANSFMGRLFQRYSRIVDDTMMVSSRS